MHNETEDDTLDDDITDGELAVVAAFRAAEQDLPPADPRALAHELRNDLGNARRLQARHGADMKYVEGMGWVVWDAARWRVEDGPAQAMIRAHQTAEAILAEADALPEFDEPEPNKATAPEAHEAWEKRRDRHASARRGLQKFAISSGNAGRCAAMLSAAEPYLRLSPDRLDANPFLLNVQNGTIELGDRVLIRAPIRSDYVTRMAPVTYDANASCLGWNAFINDVFEGQHETAIFVQKWLGYALTGDQSEQVISIFEGKGSNGKSTLLEVVARIMGDYAATTPVETILHQDKKGGSGPSPDVARLRGVRLVRTSEPEAGSRLSESFMKQWTGGEKMTVRHLHREFFELAPMGKLTVSVNIRPVIVGKDHGTRRRIHVVPFKRRFDKGGGESRGRTLVDKLHAEAPGILNWLIEGFRMWWADGLVPPAAVVEATDQYFAEMDPIGQFVRDACEADPAVRVSATELHDAFSAWCKQQNEEVKSLTAFGRRLNDLGFGKEVAAGRIFRAGIRIKDEWKVQVSGGSYGGGE